MKITRSIINGMVPTVVRPVTTTATAQQVIATNRHQRTQQKKG